MSNDKNTAPSAEQSKQDAGYQEAMRRSQHLYINCEDPTTKEKVAIETSRKLMQVIKDLMDTGIKHGEAFLEQDITVTGYTQEFDPETKVLHMIPSEVAKGKVKDVMLQLGGLLLSKEQAIQHLRRFVTSLMDQSELCMLTFDAVFETERDGVAMTGETIIDTNPKVIKDSHYVVMDNSMKSHRERLREYAESKGVAYPKNQDEINNSILKPGDALFSVPLTKGV